MAGLRCSMVLKINDDTISNSYLCTLPSETSIFCSGDATDYIISTISHADAYGKNTKFNIYTLDNGTLLNVKIEGYVLEKLTPLTTNEFLWSLISLYILLKQQYCICTNTGICVVSI